MSDRLSIWVVDDTYERTKTLLPKYQQERKGWIGLYLKHIHLVAGEVHRPLSIFGSTTEWVNKPNSTKVIIRKKLNKEITRF